MLTANAIAANVSLYEPPPYDLARDVTPIAQVGRVPVVLAVSTQSPYTTLAALIAAAKANPKAVNDGSPGNGSTPHLAVELFERAAGVSLMHVPYKGGSQAITDVMGGHVQMVAVNALEVQPQVQAGKLRVLAVMTPARSSIFPEVPTVAEAGIPGVRGSGLVRLHRPSRAAGADRAQAARGGPARPGLRRGQATPGGRRRRGAARRPSSSRPCSMPSACATSA